MRRVVAFVLAVCVGLILLQGPSSPSATAHAQQNSISPEPGTGVGTLPAVGPMVYEEPLTKPGVFLTGDCPSGNAGSEIVDEGVMLKTHGRCLESQEIVAVGPFLSAVVIPDGEFRIDFKIVKGVERAAVNVGIRFRTADAAGGYVFNVTPATGRAAIVKHQAGEPPATIVERTDLGGAFRRDTWNTLSLRVLGPRLWLVVNDQPAVTVEDGAFGLGTVPLNVERIGNPDDDAEVAVVFRHLRVSALEGAPAGRTPIVEIPSILAQGQGLLPLAR